MNFPPGDHFPGGSHLWQLERNHMDIYFADIKTPSGHFCDEVISSLQKFIRRADVENAERAAYELYYTGGEAAEYLWKRLLVISAEDIGLAQPNAPAVIWALSEIRKQLPFDSADYAIVFTQAVRYLCASAKDQGAANLSSVMKRRIRRGDPWELPDYVYDMHTRKGREKGRGYAHFIDEASKLIPPPDKTLNPWREELTAMLQEEEDVQGAGVFHRFAAEQ